MIKYALTISLSFLLLNSPAALAFDSKNANTDIVIKLARDTAKIAGGARYCKIDKELIEEFIVKAQARIASQAHDQYEKVIGSMEFKNMLAAHTAKTPDTDCKTLERAFKDTLRSS